MWFTAHYIDKGGTIAEDSGDPASASQTDLHKMMPWHILSFKRCLSASTQSRDQLRPASITNQVPEA